ncbi:MAG: radical SAM protein [Thermodesulfobacteriota bacterium]
MKILLINPPQVISTKYDRPYIFQPTGLLYVAASLEQHCRVEILDAALAGWRNLKVINGKHHLGLSFEEVGEEIRRRQPDVVGVSVPFSINAQSAHQVCAQIKKINPAIVAVVGGPHPSIRPQEVLADSNVDFVVRGEGERTMPELVRAIAEKWTPNQLRHVQGIGFRQGEDIVLTEPRPLIQDLDTLPFPARHLVPMEEYFAAMRAGVGARAMYTSGDKWVSLITSRGCPYSCNFCSIHLVMGRRFRPRSPDNVLEEIRRIRTDYDVRHFNFEDDNLTLHNKRAKELFGLLTKECQGITWSTPNGIRADSLDEELVEKMRESGCQRVFVAPESGDQEVVNNIIGKKQDLGKVLTAVQLLHQHGITVDGSFVLGSIGETKWNVLKTIRYAKKLKKAGMNLGGFHMATPYYGTPLYDEAKQKGYLVQEADDKLSTWEALINTPQLNAKTLSRLHKFAQWHVNLNFRQKIATLLHTFFPAALPVVRFVVNTIKALLLLPAFIGNWLRLWSTIFANMIRYGWRKATGQLPKIENIVYEVTDACNSRCKHCFIWKGKPTRDTLRPEEIRSILEQDIFANLKVVLLTGGEPVLHKEIKEIITAIHKTRPGVTITLSTNGLLPEKILEVARFAIANNIVMHYGVSLDGVGEHHDAIRGVPGNFAKTDFLLRQLLQLKEEHKNNMGGIVIGFTLSNLTVNNLQGLREYAAQIQLPLLPQLYEQFSYYSNMSPSEAAQNYKTADNQELTNCIESLTPAFHHEVLLAALEQRLHFDCDALGSFFVLHPNGDISPCLHFSDVRVGNIRSAAVKEVWLGKAAQDARARVARCLGCSNSWATTWSFLHWPFPFVRIRLALFIKKLKKLSAA